MASWIRDFGFLPGYMDSIWSSDTGFSRLIAMISKQVSVVERAWRTFSPCILIDFIVIERGRGILRDILPRGQCGSVILMPVHADPFACSDDLMI